MTRTLLDQLREHYGEAFDTCITAASVEGRVQHLLREVGVDGPATMHFGEERSRDDFGDRDVGLVHGSIDPGDGYVLDLLAEAGLDAAPETVETEDGESRRAHGRGFEGPDADMAATILASVREHHVAQAAGRYARRPDDPAAGATVFVHTSALPEGFADCQVPGVEWVATDAQRTIIETLRERGRATARDLAEATGYSKRHVADTLERFLEDSVVTCRPEAGSHGADLYIAGETARTGVVDLGTARITNAGVWDIYTWALAIRAVDLSSTDRTGHSQQAPGPIATSLAAFAGEPPPSG